uniref:CinA family protein n=1 Tax=Eubacterium cellulosolvens TaxID=29322 RepID=UPI0004809F62|nr:CinA family protein [[Eubacterium] cellulosolvens]
MDQAGKVVEKLMERKLHISFAESCTGGLAAAALVDIPDASKVFDASFVTYANEAKMKYLGVDDQTIGECGVVSEEVAGQMARGCAMANGAEVGVGISGIAGPGGGTEKKPVGMVCFGFFADGRTETFTRYFGEIGRNEVRRLSVAFVYDHLLELL